MKKILIVLAATILLTGCGPSAATPTHSPAQAGVFADSGAPALSTATSPPVVPSAAEGDSMTETPAPQEPVAYGPDDFPAGINPLTGLPASDPSLLGLPAVLVSITNFPVSARPQAGLSFSPIVFEIYISEGTTRYLAVYYGDFPQATVSGASGALVDQVGPVRSGRLPYAYIRDAFQWSCLVYASASEELRARLRGCDIVYGEDPNDINSAFVDVTRLEELAQGNAKPSEPFNYTGNVFSDAVPSGGQAADTLRVFYSHLNQTMWTYDPATGKYLRSQNSPSTPEQFAPDTDRLTGQQLVFSNVIVMFAKHTAVTPTIIDIDMSGGEGGYAYLFRDGKVSLIQWTTLGGDYETETGLRRPIRFIDDAGNPIALKPGNAWVHVMTPFSTVSEESSGTWLARFYAPAGAK